MKTLVDIDEDVLKEAMDLSQATTKKETIHRALEEFIKLILRQRLKALAGSGSSRWNLHDLKAARRKREKTHARLKKAGR